MGFYDPLCQTTVHHFNYVDSQCISLGKMHLLCSEINGHKERDGGRANINIIAERERGVLFFLTSKGPFSGKSSPLLLQAFLSETVVTRPCTVVTNRC